jgi:hypothetical protein
MNSEASSECGRAKAPFLGAFRQHLRQKGRQSGYGPPFQALVENDVALLVKVAQYIFLGGAGSYDAVDHIA